MYETPRLPGTAAPLAVPVASQYRNTTAVEVDPVRMWHSFVGTLSRRRWLFAAVFFGVVGAIAIATLLTPKRWTTEIKMIAGNPSAVAQNPQNAQTGIPYLNSIMLGDPARSAETYTELIGETPVVQKVIDNLDLKTSVRALQGAVKVKPITNTNIIAVSVAWSSPEMSAQIANEFAKVFVLREAELVSGQANGARELLAKRLPEARDTLAQAERNLSDYQTKHHIADMSTQTNATVNSAVATDAKINAVELDKRQADAQVASFSSALAGMKSTTGGGSSVAQNPVLAQLNTQLATAQTQLDTAQQQYTDSHPAGHQPQGASRRPQAADREDAADDRRDDEHHREPGLSAGFAAAGRRPRDERERRGATGDAGATSGPRSTRSCGACRGRCSTSPSSSAPRSSPKTRTMRCSRSTTTR